MSERGSQRGGRPRTSENVEDVLHGTQNRRTDFSGTWAPDPHFLSHSVSVAIAIPNNISQVYIFIMLSILQSNKAFSHVLSHLRIAVPCEVGNIHIIHIGKLRLKGVIGFTKVTQLANLRFKLGLWTLGPVLFFSRNSGHTDLHFSGEHSASLLLQKHKFLVY